MRRTTATVYVFVVEKNSRHTNLPSLEATQQLAENLGSILRPGDVVGLGGGVGAGKSTFARALIQDQMTRHGLDIEDVPSPTFTLIQTYQINDFEIWHCDLYRLESPAEALELGLFEAFETAISLVEWPDRLAEEWPKQSALMLTFVHSNSGSSRDVELKGALDWATRLEGVI